MSDLLIGLDVGTTATKALLLDMDGHVVASATRGYGLITGPGQGWVEQDAEELWQAVVETLRTVTSQCGPGQRIVAASQSSQGGTTIPVDAGGHPTYHALSGMDQRAVQELAEVSREAGAESIRQTTGWPLGPGLPLLHIRWLKQLCPAEFSATHRFLFVNDFIGQRLTGQPCMDPSNTSITQLMDLATGDWDARLLGIAGIRRDRLSPLQPSGTVIGSLHRAASEATSLPIGTLAINGAHDQYCAAVATGVTMPGRLLLSCGTAWVLCSLTWWLMMRAGGVLELAVLNAIASFTRAIAMNLILILTGLLASHAQRGQRFGLLSLTMGVSLLLSGAAAGPLVDRWGFLALLAANALIGGLCLLPGLYFVDVTLPRAAGPANLAVSWRLPLGGTYVLLLWMTLFASLAYHMAALGRNVAMGQLGFSATAISITTVIAGAVIVPTPVLLGWLADRWGRKRPLLTCWLIGIAALLILARANSAWAFWVASALLGVMACAFAVINAFATDVLPAASLGVGLSLQSATVSCGYLLGSLAMGVSMEQLGTGPAFMIAAGTGLLAIALLLPIGAKAGRPLSVAGGSSGAQPPRGL